VNAVIDIFGDFETRGVKAPKDVGAVNYALHPRTLPLMFAYGTLKEQRQWVLPLPHAPTNVPTCPGDLVDLINNPAVRFHAHNAAFELAIWNLICVARWGWPRIPLERWCCTAAKCRSAGQPGGLDKAGKRLKLDSEFTKDARGKELIELLSVPTKTQTQYWKVAKGPDGKSIKDPNDPKGRRVVKYKNPLSRQYLEEVGIETFELTTDDGNVFSYFFNEDPELMEEYRSYNLQDIIAEAKVDKTLPAMTEMNRETWLLDRKINNRGIPIDLDLCRGAMEVYAVESVAYDEELKELTKSEEHPKGYIDKPTQSKRIVTWLNEFLDWKSMYPSKPSPKTGKIGDGSLAQPIIPDFIAIYKDRPHAWGELPWCVPDDVVPYIMPKILRVLDIRDIAGGTAVSKYNGAINWQNGDHRAREQLLVFGASTARWTGKGIQPHNMIRKATLDDTFIEAVTSGSHSLVESMGQLEALDDEDGKPMSVIDVLKGCARGLIMAPDGKKLVVSDFAGIESRVLNWLCGNEYKLDLFRRKEDTYIHAAVPIYFNAPPGTVEYNEAFESITEWSDKKQKRLILKTHKDKRQIGKGCELGLGYGMGASTFRVNAIKAGNEMTEAFAADVVQKWRAASPEIPDFWYGLEKACKAVILNERERQKCKSNPPKALVKEVCKIKVGWHPRGYLCLKLPSGRFLYYYGATLAKDRAPNAMDDSRKIFYWDQTKTGHAANRGKISTYSGKLVENVVQAVARDLLDYAMKLIDRAGLKLIFHVHDEAVVEAAEDDDDQAFDIVHAAMETLPPWAEGLPLEAESYQARRYTK